MRAPVAVSPLILVALTSALLSACAEGPNFHAPDSQVPADWSAGAAPAEVDSTPAPDLAQWWSSFNDAELNSLVSRAVATNLDAKAAVVRIAQARAQRDIAGADGWPSLSANASGQVNRLSESTPTGALFSKVGSFPGLSGVSIPNPYDQYQLGLDASWELDLFGRVRRSAEAADADTQASVEDSRAVLVSVLGDVGRSYIDLRGAQVRRQLTQQSIATEAELLDLAAERRRAGLSSEVDIANAAAALSSAQAQLPALDGDISTDINALSKLLAAPPGALRAELATDAPALSAPSAPMIGLPADLARRRPDIREAEARLHAATARVGVAVADLYPRITLSADGGYQAQSLAQLTDWASRFLVAGPTVELPIFDAGRRRATVRLQTAEAQGAAIDYRATVLTALNEVEDALATYGADQARQAALASTVAHDRDAVELARQRYASGIADDIGVLDAQRNLEQNQLASAEAAAAVSGDLVTLYRSLGGGWR